VVEDRKVCEKHLRRLKKCAAVARAGRAKIQRRNKRNGKIVVGKRKVRRPRKETTVGAGVAEAMGVVLSMRGKIGVVPRIKDGFMVRTVKGQCEVWKVERIV
jgi:hypothetical protein